MSLHFPLNGAAGPLAQHFLPGLGQLTAKKRMSSVESRDRKSPLARKTWREGSRSLEKRDSALYSGPVVVAGPRCPPHFPGQSSALGLADPKLCASRPQAASVRGAWALLLCDPVPGVFLFLLMLMSQILYLDRVLSRAALQRKNCSGI